MKKNIKDLLNKLKWDPRESENKSRYSIICTDRKYKEAVIPYSQVYEIDSFGITILGDVYIPFHRIKQVKKENEIVWRK